MDRNAMIVTVHVPYRNTCENHIPYVLIKSDRFKLVKTIKFRYAIMRQPPVSTQATSDNTQLKRKFNYSRVVHRLL